MRLHRDIEFLRDYKDRLYPLNYIIESYNPNYILALIRKGPRLIELLNFAGLLDLETPIITERALDFIPAHELKGKKILVFDDIVISGTTIHNIFDMLPKKIEDLEMKMLSIAVDKDTYCKESMPDNFENMINITKDERFTFSNQLVKSFTFLNKPYDLDYSIFYTNINNEAMSKFLSSDVNIEKAYDVTTKYQEKNGFVRYSFIPDDITFSRFFIKYFNDIPIQPEICKVRIYSDLSNGETAVTPIVTFSMEKKFCSLQYNYFNNEFSFFNDLMKRIEQFTDGTDRKLPIFKLFWYILSYIYGLSFNIRHSTEDFQLLTSAYPSQMLHFQDLSYIFGPSFTEYIIKFLDNHYLETITAVNKLNHDFLSNNAKTPMGTKIEPKKSKSVFDNRRLYLYNEIHPYINRNMDKNKDLPSNIATIFEALYYKKELPMQMKIEKYGMDGMEHKRLSNGFNLNQIREILRRENLNFTRVELSASLDFVVDIGSQIPIFYNADNYDLFERAYRYGEDAFSGKLYEYIVADTTKELFDYIHKKEQKNSMPKIPFEKIGVMIYNDIVDSGFKPDLRYPQGLRRDREITVSPKFYLHGAILTISDIAKYSTHTSWLTFCDWCKSAGIVRYDVNDKMVLYSNSWFERNISGPKLPKPVSDRMIPRFENLAVLLYQIDRFIDKEHQSDYLIALTTCKDNRHFLEALIAELKLFFKSESYSFSITLNQMKILISDYPEEINEKCGSALRIFKEGSYPVAHSLNHKRDLYRNINNITKKIETYFLNSDWELRSIYKITLANYLEKIKEANGVPTNCAVAEFENKILNFDELCIQLSEILRSLMELIYNSNSKRARILKGGKIHGNDFKRLKSSCDKFYRALYNWNDYIDSHPNISFNGFIIKNLKMEPNTPIIPNRYNKKIYKDLFIYMFPLVERAYEALDEIYDNNFSDPVILREFGRLFPWIKVVDDELETKPWKWILWYDIKDYGGSRNSENKEKGPLLVRYINEKLDQIKSVKGDGFFSQFDSDDGKYILIEKNENVNIFLNELLRCAKSYNMFYRISLCHVSDTGESFKIYKENNRIAATVLHILAKRLANYLKDSNAEKDGCHSLFITIGSDKLLWDGEIPSYLREEWTVSEKLLHYKELKGVKKYVGFYPLTLQNPID